MSSNVFAANVYYSGNVIVSQTLNVATINVTSTVSGTTLTASTAVNTSGTGVYQVAGTTVIDASRNLTNIGTVGSGAITSTSTVSGTTITASSSFSGPGTNLTGTAASLNVGGTSGGLSGTPNITVGTVVEGITTASATPAAAANVLTVIGSSTTGNVVQFSNSAGGRFVMTSGGNVGVGVTNPTQALEVAGSAVVAGTLSAGNPLMFRNALYNGDMRIAQRGTSFVNPSSQYTLDRWYLEGYGAVGNGTVSQIQSGLANFSNAFQLATTSTSLGNWMISQSLETRDIVRFQGQAVTVSFWYRIPVNFTQAWTPALYWTASNDTKITNGVNGSPNAAVFGTILTLTTAWTYVQYQAFVPSTAQALSVMFTTYNNTVNGAQLQFTGVQLEKGSVATPFEVRPFATELALCQRYFHRNNSYLCPMTIISTTNTNQGQATYKLPVTMRSVPAISYSGTPTLDWNSVSYNTVGGLTISGNTDVAILFAQTIGNGNAGSVTVGQVRYLYANGGNIDFNSEL
jgi:hypothetical protein